MSDFVHSKANSKQQKSAFEACREGGSVLTLVGLAPLTEDVGFNTFKFIRGKSINGTYFGGKK